MPQVDEQQRDHRRIATIDTEREQQVARSESFALIDANVASVPLALADEQLATSVESIGVSVASKVSVCEREIKSSVGHFELNNNDQRARTPTQACEPNIDLRQLESSAKPKYLLPGLRMSDQLRKSSLGAQAATSSAPNETKSADNATRSSPRINSVDQKQASQTSSIPSYNSIFNTASPKATNLDDEILNTPTGEPYRLPAVTPPAQKQRWSQLAPTKTNTRTTLKKHCSTESSARKLLVFNYETSPRNDTLLEKISCASAESVSFYDENEPEDEAELTNDDIDERLPFNALQRQRERTMPSAKQQPASGAKKALTCAEIKALQRQNSLKRADNVQMNAKQKHSTKISMHEQQAPICRQYEQKQLAASCRKLDLLEQAAYLNCDCSVCAKKRKLAGFVQGHGSAPALAAPAYYPSLVGQQQHHHLGELSKSALLVEKGYPKTRVMHLILKSIILVLCTLLLLTLLIGAAMLSISLPQAVDKITNVSRSFNVTIAGRR